MSEQQPDGDLFDAVARCPECGNLSPEALLRELNKQQLELVHRRDEARHYDDLAGQALGAEQRLRNENERLRSRVQALTDRLAPVKPIRRRALRKHIERTRHRYWGKGGQVSVPELTDRVMSFLHEQGVQVADDDWENFPSTSSTHGGDS